MMTVLQQNMNLVFFALFAGICLRYFWITRKLEKELKLKDAMSAKFSHAIRTPLTTLCGIATLFNEDQAKLDAEHKQLVRRLVSSTAALKKLIEEDGESYHA